MKPSSSERHRKLIPSSISLGKSSLSPISRLTMIQVQAEKMSRLVVDSARVMIVRMPSMERMPVWNRFSLSAEIFPMSHRPARARCSEWPLMSERAVCIPPCPVIRGQ